MSTSSNDTNGIKEIFEQLRTSARDLGEETAIYITYGRLMESILYFVITYNILPSHPILLDDIDKRISDLIQISLPIIISAIVAVFIPSLSFQIFDTLPTEAVMRRILSNNFSAKHQNSRSDAGDDTSVGDQPKINPSLIETNRYSDPRALLRDFAKDSGSVAQKIYNRAGVYLLSGAVIAFAGLGIFLLRPASYSSGTNDFAGKLLDLAPNFGILFFIEFIALFFLRQYRSAMDDFRYYDAVRRQREENLIILNMFAENTVITSTQEVIKSMSIYSSAGKINKDETTDIIESRRLYRDEYVMFEKIAEAISAVRGRAGSEK